MHNRLRGQGLPTGLQESNLKRLAERMSGRQIRIANRDCLPNGFTQDKSGFIRQGHALWELRDAEDGMGGYVLVRKEEERAPDMHTTASLELGLKPRVSKSAASSVATAESNLSQGHTLRTGTKVATYRHGRVASGVIVKVVPSTGAVINFADGSSQEVPIDQLFQDEPDQEKDGEKGDDEDGDEDLKEMGEGLGIPVNDIVGEEAELVNELGEDLEDLVEILADPYEPDIEPSSKADGDEEQSDKDSLEDSDDLDSDDEEDPGEVVEAVLGPPDDDSEVEDNDSGQEASAPINDDGKPINDEAEGEDDSYQPDKSRREAAPARPQYPWYGQRPQDWKLRPRSPEDTQVTGITPSQRQLLRPRSPHDVSVTGLPEPSAEESYETLPGGIGETVGDYSEPYTPSRRIMPHHTEVTRLLPYGPREPTLQGGTHGLPDIRAPLGPLMTDEELDRAYGPNRGPPRSTKSMEGTDYAVHPAYEPLERSTSQTEPTTLQRDPSKKKGVFRAIVTRLEQD